MPETDDLRIDDTTETMLANVLDHLATRQGVSYVGPDGERVPLPNLAEAGARFLRDTYGDAAE